MTVSRRRRPTPLRPRLAAAAPIIGAPLALLAPIVLWTVFGDGDPLRTLEVALAAAILAWAVVRRAEVRDDAVRPPASRRRPSQGAHGHPGRVSGATRPPRNVRCSATAERQLERRDVRRRSRP